MIGPALAILRSIGNGNGNGKREREERAGSLLLSSFVVVDWLRPKAPPGSFLIYHAQIRTRWRHNDGYLTELVRHRPESARGRQASKAVGIDSGGEAVVKFLADRFTDHSQKLTAALQTANDRAWKAIEVALAGDSLWERCKVTLASAEDQAFREQVRAFLDVSPLTKASAEYVLSSARHCKNCGGRDHEGR